MPQIWSKDIPRGKELCHRLGFRLGSSAKPQNKLLESTHSWRRHYYTPEGIAGKDLLDWNSPQVQRDLKQLAVDYLDSGSHGVRFWPARELFSRGSVPEYPKDKHTLVTLISQLVWRQNTNEFYNQSKNLTSKRKTQKRSLDETEVVKDSSPSSSTNDVNDTHSSLHSNDEEHTGKFRREFLISFSCNPSFLHGLAEGNPKGHASNAKATDADRSEQVSNQSIIDEDSEIHEDQREEDDAPRNTPEELQPNTEKRKQVFSVDSFSSKGKAIRHMATRSSTSYKNDAVNMQGNKSQMIGNKSRQKPPKDFKDIRMGERGDKERERFEDETPDLPTRVKRKVKKGFPTQKSLEDLGLENAELKRRLRKLEKQAQMSEREQHPTLTPLENIEGSPVDLDNNMALKYLPSSVPTTQHESGADYTSKDFWAIGNRNPNSDNSNMQSRKRSLAELIGGPIKRAKGTANSAWASNANESDIQRKKSTGNPIQARSDRDPSESVRSTQSRFHRSGSVPQTNESVESNEMILHGDIPLDESEDVLPEQYRKVRKARLQLLPQTSISTRVGGSLQLSPAQAHIDGEPRVFIRFVIIKNRHPRLTTRDWNIQSLAKETTENVFKEVGKIVPRKFEALTFRLSTSERDQEVMITKGGEDCFMQMQKNFAKAVKMDVKSTKNRGFLIEIEPEVDETTTTLIDDDSDERDLGDYI